MNKQDRGKLVGMVLGDGYIRTASAKDKLAGRRIAPQIVLGHSIHQEDYMKYKTDILNKMFGGNASIGYKDGKYKSCYLNKSNPYFKTLKGMMYKNGEKYISRQVLDMLTPEGIAIWFMDDGSYRINRRSDGSVSSISLAISTYCSKEEVDEIIKYFKEKYDITFKSAFCKRTQLWYIRANTSDSRKFSNLILPYMIGSMLYKVSCVQMLDGHECAAPDKVCKECGNTFASLKAKGLCMNCYNTKYFNNLSTQGRECSICGEVKNAKWYVGSRCRACYQREKR